MYRLVSHRQGVVQSQCSHLCKERLSSEIWTVRSELLSSTVRPEPNRSEDNYILQDPKCGQPEQTLIQREHQHWQQHRCTTHPRRRAVKKNSITCHFSPTYSDPCPWCLRRDTAGESIYLIDITMKCSPLITYVFHLITLNSYIFFV